jgi:formylmethanofuran dehydrogenase subunit E
MDKKITINEAIKFHGHLGPYLVLGLKAGELALKRLGVKKYFGLIVKVYGATQKPKSCLIDGLQLSTGTTYGKGNIEKFNGNKIMVEARRKEGNRKVRIELTHDLINRLEAAKTHEDCEALAKILYNTDQTKLFSVRS